MAATEGSAITEKTLAELSALLWGRRINEDLFKRWNQGFRFSEDEPTALVQLDGGPCAVIVPLQAYILKNLLFVQPQSDNWRFPSAEQRDAVFCEAVTDILLHSSSNNSVTIVTPNKNPQSPRSPVSTLSTAATAPDVSSPSSPSAAGPADETPESRTVASSTADDVLAAQLPVGQTAKRLRLSHEEFHSTLWLTVYKGRPEVLGAVRNVLNLYYSDCGVLILLYSILLTRGIEQIKQDVADLDEPLIDSVHGHGSQSLINLLMTGKAASHVWDNEKDVSGLKLQGISSKSEIGFLTLLEHLRYCEVGWYLKNPVYPIWLLGSETHLTVLFSLDRTLVGEESSVDKARRLFGIFDQEGRGFISVESLGDLMQQLDLVAVPEYVKIMAEKLDPEQLGVITLNGFLEEFFATGQSGQDEGHRFTVYHYNGLPQSCPDNKVSYLQATCVIMDMPELQMISDFSPIKTCLLTKWPTIELNWRDNVVPSMN